METASVAKHSLAVKRKKEILERVRKEFDEGETITPGLVVRKLRRLNVSCLMDREMPIMGITVCSEGDAVVVISRTAREKRVLTETMLHELGHVLLHRNQLPHFALFMDEGGNLQNKLEELDREAEFFAKLALCTRAQQDDLTRDEPTVCVR